LEGLKLSDPAKYDQTLKLRNTLKMMDDRNAKVAQSA
jgi:hypothetical protein